MTKGDFEIARKASHLFEEAASNWMARAQVAGSLLAEAEKALAPLADFADKWSKVPKDLIITHGSTLARPQLRMGDCYEARAVLAKIKAAQGVT